MNKKQVILFLAASVIFQTVWAGEKQPIAQHAEKKSEIKVASEERIKQILTANKAQSNSADARKVIEFINALKQPDKPVTQPMTSNL